MDPIDQTENYVSELADAHALMDEADVPRFNTKTGETLSLRERIESYANVKLGKHLIDMLQKSVEIQRNRPQSPFDGPFGPGRSPFDR